MIDFYSQQMFQNSVEGIYSKLISSPCNDSRPLLVDTFIKICFTQYFFAQFGELKTKTIFSYNLLHRDVSGYHYCTTSFNYARIQVLRKFKQCLRCVADSRWARISDNVPSGNKAKRLFNQPYQKNNLSSFYWYIYFLILQNQRLGEFYIKIFFFKFCKIQQKTSASSLQIYSKRYSDTGVFL